MSAEEFIETYGRIEMMKLQKAEELGQSNAASESLSQSMSGASLSHRGAGKMDGKPAIGMGDMKQMLKDQLNNVKLYGEKRNSIGGAAALESRKSTKQISLAQLEKEYDMPKFGNNTSSIKTSRNSTHNIGSGLLKPPTSLKTPTASSYSSLSNTFKSTKH